MIDNIVRPKVTTSRTPSAFAAANFSLAPGESTSIISIYGHSTDIETLYSTILPRIHSSCFVEHALTRARLEARRIVAKVSTASSSTLFDAYTQMSFLDNTLRGGLPVDLADFEALHSESVADRASSNIGTDSHTSPLPVSMSVKENRQSKIFHTYSRIHGDLERDYNNIQLDYTPFAQGPGNFRDINQNRRTDIFQVFHILNHI